MNNVDKLVSGATQIVGLIRHSIVSLDRHMFVQLFKILVHPKLAYNDAIWHPYANYHIVKIESVQDKL